VIRAKGFFWVATRHNIVAEWSQAGGVLSVRPMGMWWAAVTEEERAAQADLFRESAEPHWREPHGDRRQEIAFIGSNMDRGAIEAALDACLLTDEEFAAGPIDWMAFTDPIPNWRPGHEDVLVAAESD
jgi:G3E family GTPase